MIATSKQSSLSDNESISFIDLSEQQRLIRPGVDAAIKRVLDHGKYIMGPEVFELEERLEEHCGVRHAVSCASGTDALLMILMAKGIGPGDAVLCPGFTFTATPEVIALLGASPVFVDVSAETFNLDGNSISAGVAAARDVGLTPRAVIAVDLFGQPASYDDIHALAAEHDLWVIGDAAQSFGATYKGRRVGGLALATATSFFPAKPLGCYGDGGAIFTDDDALAEVCNSIRIHGKGSDKYDNVRVGLNARLDTIQAAILLEKLKIFPGEIVERNRVAEHYSSCIGSVPSLVLPEVLSCATSVWAQYTIRVSQELRESVIKTLDRAGVPTAVYYPKPLHWQNAYSRYPLSKGGLPVSERLSSEVLSLPMHPYLTYNHLEYIVNSLLSSLSGSVCLS